MDEAIRILEMPDVGQDDKMFGIIVRAKCAVINTIQTTALRVSEERFRQQRFDRLPELIALIQSEEKKLPAHLLEQASGTG